MSRPISPEQYEPSWQEPDWLTAEMDRQAAAGIPNLDNVVDPDVIGHCGLEYDGPTCAADDCRTPVDDDGEMCADCGDEPHEFIHDGDPRFDHCACGRIRSIGGYSPVHTDEDGAA